MMLRRFLIVLLSAPSLLVATASLAEEPAEAPPQAQERASLWDRPELLRFEGGPRDWLESHGIALKLWLTQFYQGTIAGEGDHTWQYGGRGDVFLTTDFSKLGLWNGFSLNVHGEGVFGDDANFTGDGSLLPLNTAMAFPRLFGRDFDLSSVHFTQKFPWDIALSLGKIDMLDVATKTPLMSGGGILSFQNLAFAAPPSGLVPAAIFGGLLSVPIERVKLTLGIYDPQDASAKTGLEEPFVEGVTGLLSATVPLPIAGRPGYHSLSAKANNKVGLDLDDLAGILLPSESEDVLGEKKGAWNVSYSFQQYLYADPNGSGGGWGIFGQIGRSDGNPTPFDWFGYIGLGGTSLIPSRSRDRFGAGFFYLSLSDDLVDGSGALAAATGESDLLVGDEKGGELFYDAAITGWFHFALDLQVIDTHQAESEVAVVGGLRARLIF